MKKILPSIYMDYAASTPVDPAVKEAMLPWISSFFGNPHSYDHAYGWASEAAIDKSRTTIMDLLNVKIKEEIIFTSGATEANNILIQGVAKFYCKNHPKKNHIISFVTEHSSVLMPIKQLAEEHNLEVTLLPVNNNGSIDIDLFKSAVKKSTFLVSAMYSNNEISVLNPIEEIAKICSQNNIFFHTDAAQAIGKVTIDLSNSYINALTFSGHKIYTPIGIGCLYLKKNSPILPIIWGGEQEHHIRPGTVSTPLAVAIGKAMEISCKNIREEQQRIQNLEEKFISKLREKLNIKINGDSPQRLAGIVNITFLDACRSQNIPAITLLKGVAASAGSACISNRTKEHKPSYVLKALNLTDLEIKNTIRFSFGRYTTEEEIYNAANIIIKTFE